MELELLKENGGKAPTAASSSYLCVREGIISCVCVTGDEKKGRLWLKPELLVINFHLLGQVYPRLSNGRLPSTKVHSGERFWET